MTGQAAETAQAKEAAGMQALTFGAVRLILRFLLP